MAKASKSKEPEAKESEAKESSLRVVRKGATLYWPHDIYPIPEEWGNKERGWRDFMRRHPERRVRGEGGYVVDMDAVAEETFMAGQMDAVESTEGMGRKSPRKATKIECPEALAVIAARRRAAARAEGKADPVEEKGEDGKGKAPDPPAIPEVEGKMFRPYTVDALLERWAGAYIDVETEAVTHLLPSAEGAEPVAIGDVEKLSQPVPLVPQD